MPAARATEGAGYPREGGQTKSDSEMRAAQREQGNAGGEAADFV